MSNPTQWKQKFMQWNDSCKQKMNHMVEDWKQKHTREQRHVFTVAFAHKGEQKTVHVKHHHIALVGMMSAFVIGFAGYNAVSYHQTQQALLESQSQLQQQEQSNETLSKQRATLEQENEQYMQNITEIQQKATELENKMSQLEAQKQELSNQLNELAQADTASADTCLSILEEGVNTSEKSFTNIVTTAYNKPEVLATQLEKIDTMFDQTSVSFISVANDVTYTLAQQASIPSGWPTSGYVSSEFDADGSFGRVHKGMDIATRSQIIPITATASGTVVEAEYSSSYGYYVKINHGNGFTTLYAHNSENLVEVGDTVTKGDEIAMTGSTGISTGVHCHYEIQLNGIYQNPRDYE